MNSLWNSVKKVFKFIYRVWMKFAHTLGKINSFILLTVFYFVIFGIGRFVLWVGKKDVLEEHWKDKPSYWKKRQKLLVTEGAFLKPY